MAHHATNQNRSIVSTPRCASALQLQEALVDEIVMAFGARPRGLARAVLGPLASLPASRFARVMAAFDRDVAVDGVVLACDRIVRRLAAAPHVMGQQHVPSEGPLLVLANHPGTVDAMAVVASLGRPDIKVVVSGAPFFQRLVAASEHMIYAPPVAQVHGRMATVRAVIRHLRDDGAVLILPGGLISPDPDLIPGAEEHLDTWSSSVEVVLRQVPQTQMLVGIVSGVLAERCWRHPLTRLRSRRKERQRLAEFLQVISQMLFGARYDLAPRVSFAGPVRVQELVADNEVEIMPALVERARELLVEHMANAPWKGVDDPSS